MSEAVKRSLRAKKPSHYLNHDIEEPERVGYTREVYLREYISPAQELNSTAKLMAKFINSVNKHLKDASLDDQRQNKQRTQIMALGEGRDDRNQEKRAEMSKKKNAYREKMRDQAEAQARNMVNNMAQMRQKIGSRSSNLGQTNELRSMSKSKNKVEAGVKDKMSEPNFQNRSKQPRNTLNPNPQKLPSNSPNPQLQSTPLPKPQPQAPRSLSPKNPQKNKLFGRSTFHVAIAYSIYFKQLQSSNGGVNNSKVIDPTYPAKKLRGDCQERTRVSQEETF